MPVEYSAVAIGFVGLMFFLLDLGTRINFQTSGQGFIDINTIAKTFFTILSVGVGLGLALFMYAAGTDNAAAIEAILVVVINYWVFVTCAVLLLFIIYFWLVIPRLLQKAREP